MTVRPLRAVISSKMQELDAERRAIKAALDDMRIESFVFEVDAGARPQTIQQTFLEEVESADLYIGVFWKSYGRYTIEEYERASVLGMDCLIYEKRKAVDGQRDPELSAFLERLGDVETGLTVKWFHTPSQLAESVKDDIARWQAEKIREAESECGPRLFVDVPRTPSHFEGRDELALGVIRSLKRHDLAITGLPGVGKTAFAVAIARHTGILRHFRDGILWGSVGPSSNTERVLATWAAALSVPVDEQMEPATLSQRVRDAIGSRSVLIILDDVWQLQAVELLRVAGPNCVVLLITRDLGVARRFAGAEGIIEVPPLYGEAAFALLRRLAPEACSVDERRARAVAKSTGGLPLALELIGGFLAAPEHSLFRELIDASFDEISDPGLRLELAFTRLGGADGRQVTLQETILLSLTGLPQPAIEAFYRLGVFAPKPASFSLEAAKAVLGVDARHLALLVARCLARSAGDDRLELHQVLADAANAQPIADRFARQLAHCRYYANLAAAAMREYALNNESRTPGSGTAAYRREQQQIDSAVAWLMSQQPSKETDDPLVDFAQAYQFMPTAALYDEAERARVRSGAIVAAGRIGKVDAKARLQLAESMQAAIQAQFFKMSGRLDEAAQLYRSALESVGATRDLPKNWLGFLPGELGKSYSDLFGDGHTFELLTELSTIYRTLNRREEATEFSERCLTLARDNGRQDWEADALGTLATLYGDAGQNERAFGSLEQRWTLLAQTPLKAADRAETLGNLGVLAFRLGSSEKAKSYLEQAVKVAEEAIQPSIVRASTSLLATLSEQAGEPDQAIAYLMHQLKIVRWQLGRETTEGKNHAEVLGRFFGANPIDEWQLRIIELGKEESEILNRVGRLSLQRSDPNAAIEAFAQSLQVNEALKEAGGTAVALANLGDAYQRAGNVARAVESYETAIPKLRAAGNWHGFFLAIEGLTNICVTQSEYSKAIEHLQAAHNAAATLGDTAQQLEALDRLGSIHAIVSDKTSSPDVMKQAIDFFKCGFDLAAQTNNDKMRATFEAGLAKARFQLALMER